MTVTVTVIAPGWAKDHHHDDTAGPAAAADSDPWHRPVPSLAPIINISSDNQKLGRCPAQAAASVFIMVCHKTVTRDRLASETVIRQMSSQVQVAVCVALLP